MGPKSVGKPLTFVKTFWNAGQCYLWTSSHENKFVTISYLHKFVKKKYFLMKLWVNYYELLHLLCFSQKECEIFFLPYMYCQIKFLYAMILSIVPETGFLDILKMICHIVFKYGGIIFHKQRKQPEGSRFTFILSCWQILNFFCFRKKKIHKIIERHNLLKPTENEFNVYSL